MVFDEAHVLEDIMSDTVGVQIAPGRFVTVSATVRRFLDDPQLVGSIADLASVLRDALTPLAGQRLTTPLPDDIVDALHDAQLRLTRVGEAVQKIETPIEDAQQRKLRAQRMITRSMESVEAALAAGTDTVPFVSGSRDHPRLEIAPARRRTDDEVRACGSSTPAILTSATIPASLGRRIGLDADRSTEVDVGSPVRLRDSRRFCTARCTYHRRSHRSSASRSQRS